MITTACRGVSCRTKCDMTPLPYGLARFEQHERKIFLGVIAR